MALSFMTPETLRAFFWSRVGDVCGEAVEDLAAFANFTREGIFKCTPDKLVESYGFDPEMADYPEPPKDHEAVHGVPFRFDLVTRWQEKWNLDGEAEKKWVEIAVIGTVMYWAVDQSAFQERRMVMGADQTPFPSLQIPPLEIDPSFSESWNEFEKRATLVFRDALSEYKDAVKEQGMFKRNIDRDARWLVMHQVGGSSWKDVADMDELNPDDYDYDSIRKAATRLADALPLTLRT